jgi:hypothetical protein
MIKSEFNKNRFICKIREQIDTQCNRSLVQTIHDSIMGLLDIIYQIRRRRR